MGEELPEAGQFFDPILEAWTIGCGGSGCCNSNWLAEAVATLSA